MVPVGRCDHPGGCGTIPSFGVPGGKATRCSVHKEQGMVPPRRCDHPGCMTTPSFCVPGGKPTRCAEHKEVNMVNKNRCDHPDGCSKVPSFGLPGSVHATRCKAHKEEYMVNVRGRRCSADGCGKHPGFGLPGGKASHCLEHKEEDMICLTGVKCRHPGCNKRCRYEFRRRQGWISRCILSHFGGSMFVRLLTMSFSCCSFGPLGDKAAFCADHKEENMVEEHMLRCDHPNAAASERASAWKLARMDHECEQNF
jgi:hypothetical protein